MSKSSTRSASPPASPALSRRGRTASSCSPSAPTSTPTASRSTTTGWS